MSVGELNLAAPLPSFNHFEGPDGERGFSLQRRYENIRLRQHVFFARAASRQFSASNQSGIARTNRAENWSDSGESSPSVPLRVASRKS